MLVIWQRCSLLEKLFCSLEFCLLIVAGYYIVPLANGQGAQQVLTKPILHVEQKYPDPFIIALLDLNKGSFSHVPLRYKQFNKWCTGKKKKIKFGSVFHRSSQRLPCCSTGSVRRHKPGTEERSSVTPHVFRLERIATLRGVSVSVRRGRWLGKCQKTLPLQNNWVGMAFNGAHHLK